MHGCTPHGTEAVHELYTYLITSYLPQRFPTAFQLSQDNSSLKNNIKDVSVPTTPPADGAEALRILGTTVEEELFLLRETLSSFGCVSRGNFPFTRLPIPPVLFRPPLRSA